MHDSNDKKSAVKEMDISRLLDLVLKLKLVKKESVVAELRAIRNQVKIR